MVNQPQLKQKKLDPLGEAKKLSAQAIKEHMANKTDEQVRCKVSLKH